MHIRTYYIGQDSHRKQRICFQTFDFSKILDQKEKKLTSFKFFSKMQLFSEKSSGHYKSKSVSNQPRPPVEHVAHWETQRITFYITFAVGLFELLHFLLRKQLALNLYLVNEPIERAVLTQDSVFALQRTKYVNSHRKQIILFQTIDFLKILDQKRKFLTCFLLFFKNGIFSEKK